MYPAKVKTQEGDSGAGPDPLGRIHVFGSEPVSPPREVTHPLFISPPIHFPITATSLPPFFLLIALQLLTLQTQLLSFLHLFEVQLRRRVLQRRCDTRALM